MKATLRQQLTQRILLLDGGMGSMVQQYHLTEEDFRGDLFCAHEGQLQGNNDVLVLTRPDVVLDIHRRYLEAGADIITTNTFSSQRISQQEYGLTDSIDALNRAAVRLARQAADEYTARNPEQPRYVVGDVGPTSKMLSMSDDVNDPAARAITFDQLEAAYYEQILPLVEEGVDAILVETIFDTLNAKAAASAFAEVKKVKGKEVKRWPEIMFSMTVSDASGRTLSGQTVEAFVTSVMHANPLSVGLNCGLGADGILPWLRRMSAVAPCYVSCHPNAGLPNQFGGYDDTPADMAAKMAPFYAEGLVNIVGGCCGTTPEHIAAMRQAIDANSHTVRTVPVLPKELRLSGMDAFSFDAQTFVKVGERCNVAGSRKFLRLINEKKYDEALDIARKQVEDGAMVIDVNMDDGLLDAKQEMVTFLNLLASDPAIARVPVMVDSSRFEVIEAGLKCLQGKGIVNSISLKMGEEEFVAHARTVKQLGAAVIDMCFDETGQATDYERRVQICSRGYKLLTEECGFDVTDIIFDPNVLTVATGMAEHNAYAADFIRATRTVTEAYRGVRISGGLSNLSFAFRGNNYLREAMHSVFLHHAIANGMNMAILNPATEVAYKTIPAELRLAISEVILNTSPEAPEELIEKAQLMAQAKEEGRDPLSVFVGERVSEGFRVSEGSRVSEGFRVSGGSGSHQEIAKPSKSAEEIVVECLLKGISTGLDEQINALLQAGKTPLDIISGPLMEGMNQVGKLFGEGKMFLPQVVKTARTMKKAVEVLEPYFNDPSTSSGTNENALASTKVGKVLLATVKGDVHDIGKNIVGVVLACNNFEVIDLGVMVPTETIIEQAIAQHVDFVCLSGLITPSLEEMCHVATAMEKAGLQIPILVGGATTSPLHTAVKIAPCYSGGVFHIKDAAMNPVVCMKLKNPETRQAAIEENRQQQELLRTPKAPAYRTLPIAELLPLIDWSYFFYTWRTKEDTEVGRELKRDAEKLLAELAAEGSLYAPRAIKKFYPAKGYPDKNCIEITLRKNEHDPACPCCNQKIVLPTPRQTHNSPAIAQAIAKGEEYQLKSLSDFVTDSIGAFACTMSPALVKRLEDLKAAQGGGDYDVLLLQTVADRLAEAASEFLNRELDKQDGCHYIRPAIGYPSLPDQKSIFLLAKLIDFEALGIRLTENGAMYPQASTCGFYFNHPKAEYFTI